MRALFNVAASRGRPAAGCRLLPGHQLYDVVSTGLLVAAAGALTLLRPGLIYYWMKDITSEFLKIHVLFNALEILDKVCTVLWGLAAFFAHAYRFLGWQLCAALRAAASRAAPAATQAKHTPQTHHTPRSSPISASTCLKPSPAPAPSTRAAASAPLS